MSILAISGKINSGKDTLAAIIQYVDSQYNHNYKESFEKFQKTPNIKKSYWKIKRFADKLKDIVCLLLNCTREELEDREFKEKELGEEWWYYKFDNIMLPISDRKLFIQTVNSTVFSPLDEAEVDTYIIKLTPRKLLQLLGTDCGRDIIHPNIWVNALMSKYISENRGIISGINYVESNWIITDMRFPNELEAVKSKGGISVRINRPRVTLEGGDNLYEHHSETALDDAQFDYTIHNNGTIEELIEAVKIILRKEKII